MPSSMEVLDGSIGKNNAVVRVIVCFLACGSFKELPNALLILGMISAKPKFNPRCILIRKYAEYSADLRRHNNGPTCNIEFPAADMAQSLRFEKRFFAATQLCLGTFALRDVLGQRHKELRYSLRAWHKRNVVAYPNQTAVLAAILFLDLKLSSFFLHQLGDERPVGLAVVLMRYVQKIN